MKKEKLIKPFVGFLLLLFVVGGLLTAANFSNAAQDTDANRQLTMGIGGDFGDLVNRIVARVVKPLITLIWALSLLFFLWNVVRYLQSGMSEENRQEIKKTIGYSLLALFVMSAVWGLVSIIDETLGLDSDVIDTPQLLN